MRRVFLKSSGFLILLLPLLLSSCSKGSSSSASSQASKSTTSNDELTLKTFKTGPSLNLSPELYSGIYYTRFNPFRITGICSGTVKKIDVQITISTGSSNESLDCQNGSFTWEKTFSTEENYQVSFTPQKEDGSAISNLNPITKTIVYDVSAPEQPSFLLPTTGNHFLVTDSSSSLLIKGKVKKEVKKLTGPNLINLVLKADPDGIHATFLYQTTLTNNSSSNLAFTAYDGAGNTSTNTLVIETRTDVVVPLAVQEIGSSTVTNSGITIYSSAGFMVGSKTNSNIRNVIGSAGTMKEW